MQKRNYACLSLSLLQLTCRADAPLHSTSAVVSLVNSQLRRTGQKAVPTTIDGTAVSFLAFLTAESSSVLQEHHNKEDLNTKLIQSMQPPCTAAEEELRELPVLM